MSKGILNKRDKMLWDNTHKPNGVDDTLDLVSDHIEDIVEDHIEGIGESTTGYSLDYKIVADITFEQEASALNINFDEEYRKLIVKYSHPANTQGSIAIKAMYVKTLYGNVSILNEQLESTTDRAHISKVESIGIAVYSIAGASSGLTYESFPSINGIRFSGINVEREYTFIGITGTFTIPVGAKLLVLGVK